MATSVDVRQRVGEELALIEIGGTLQSQDQTRIDATYDEIYDRLVKDGIAVWESAGTIPDAVVPYLALMIEEKLLNAYSISEKRYQRIKIDAGQDGSRALAKIISYIMPGYYTNEEPTDF